MYKYIIILSLLLLVSSCAPLDRKYDNKTLQADLTAIKETGTPEQDVLLLNYYIQSRLMNKDTIQAGITYNDLLEQARIEKMQRDVQAMKQKDYENIMNIEKKTQVDSMKQIISVTLLSKNLTETDFREFFSIGLKIENHSYENIKGLKGKMIFTDVFGDTIKTAELKYTSVLENYNFVFYNAQVNYDPYSEPDINLLNAQVNNIKLLFEPEMILFDN